MNRSSRRFALLSLAVLACAGCAARGPSVSGLYAGLKEPRGALDAGAITGKTIVIDPGHGGSMNGTLGPDSLREADANLGVALYLWGLCRDAGADVHLTRTTDRDLLPPGSSDVAADLDARVQMANGLDPDVFLSIHHNANLPLNRDVNETEVYYRSSDPGSSLELAEDIQMHLARNLGIETSEVRPGNYFVLRNSTARAAVLGEASYLSHPAVEQRLRLSEKQRLEAEAYFLGLLEYFSRGVPTLSRISPARDTIAEAVEVRFAVRTDRGIPIDPASARVTVGSRERQAFFDPATSTVRLPLERDLPNGRYALVASVRSSLGATARSRADTFVLARAARFVLPLVPREKPGSIVALTVVVLDALGMPVADGTPASASPIGGDTAFGGVCAEGAFTIEVPRELERDAFVVSAAGIRDTVRFPAAADGERLALLVCDARTLEGVGGASVLGPSGESVLTDARGRALVPASGAAETLLVVANGYRPLLVDSAGVREGSSVIRALLEPVLGGALRGRRIALDPEGGGPDPAGRGPGGLRGASVNLSVARELRDLLECAGASVTLTREGDEPISAEERVYVVNRSRAELAVGIAHDKAPACPGSPRCVVHYPGSERGRSVAEDIASSLASLPPAAPCPTAEGAATFLQQTTCPAVEAYCGPIEEPAREAAMRDRRWIRLEAELLLQAVAVSFGYEAAPSPPCTVRVVSGGSPVAGATVDIDRLAVRRTDAGGSASFDRLEPGAHLVTVRAADGRTVVLMRSIPVPGGDLVIELP